MRCPAHCPPEGSALALPVACAATVLAAGAVVYALFAVVYALAAVGLVLLAVALVSAVVTYAIVRRLARHMVLSWPSRVPVAVQRAEARVEPRALGAPPLAIGAPKVVAGVVLAREEERVWSWE